jgi:hypothetical protein
MTYQQDPDRNRNVGRSPRDYIRRDDGSWSPVALVLGAVLLALIGWFVFSDRTTGPTTSTTTSSGQTNTGGSTKTPQQK